MKNILNCTGHEIKLPNIIKSDAAYLVDDAGKRYLDLESGVWCAALGHNNSAINSAIEKQVQIISHVGFCYSNDIVDDAAASILSIAGLRGGKCVFLCSGSEGIELARQVCKELTKKTTTLCLHDAYLGSYSSVLNRETGWFIFDWRDCTSCPEIETCDINCPKFSNIPDNISEFVFEPGSASGFVRFPPASMIKNLATIVKAQGGKIIINEVTTGIGRTGKWFGHNHYTINPDFIAIGKGIGNGYPVSVLAIAKDTVREVEGSNFKYMQSHQNDPLGAAVAKEVIRQLTDEDLVTRASELGIKFLSALQALTESPYITEVRGRGMMFAVELSNAEVGDEIYNQLLEKGYIVCNRAGMFRIDPPLIIKEADFYNFVNTFRSILTNT